MDAQLTEHTDDGHTWQAVVPPADAPDAMALFYCLHCPATETIEERRARMARVAMSQHPSWTSTGREMQLSPSEGRILGLLRGQLETTVTTAAIASELWPGAPLDARLKAAIRAHIYTLRRKLRGSDISVTTRAGIGYRASTTGAPQLVSVST